MRPPLPLSLLASLVACGSTRASMPYAPTVPVQAAAAAAAARPAVAVSDRVVNERRSGRGDSTWIGTVRGGYGNPVQRSNPDAPVDRVAARAFADGSAARGLRAPAGGAAPHLPAVTVHQFDANQHVRREATAEFGAASVERGTGREAWRDRHRAYNVDGSLLSLSTGVLASTEDFRRVALRTMGESVDALLDKPGFRAAPRRG